MDRDGCSAKRASRKNRYNPRLGPPIDMQSRSPKISLVVLGMALFLAQQPVGAWQSAPTAEHAKGESEADLTIAPPKPPAASAHDDTIKVSVNEVVVPVTVTDDKGRFVSDLDKKDFQIYEENKPQQMTFFTRERNQPVVIGFLLDMSTASRIHWKNFQNATEELIQNLLTGDPKYSGYLIDTHRTPKWR